MYMTLGKGQWPRVTGKNGSRKVAFLLKKSVKMIDEIQKAVPVALAWIYCMTYFLSTSDYSEQLKSNVLSGGP